MVLCFVSTVPNRFRVALFASIRPAASLRVLAAMIVAALLVTQTSSALHELLVPHRVCAEHGHRIHAGEASDWGFDAPARGRGPGVGADLTEESDQHHHCAPPARPEPAALLLQRATDAILAPITGGRALAATRVLVHAGPTILLYAPKQSPPV